MYTCPVIDHFLGHKFCPKYFKSLLTSNVRLSKLNIVYWYIYKYLLPFSCYHSYSVHECKSTSYYTMYQLFMYFLWYNTSSLNTHLHISCLDLQHHIWFNYFWSMYRAISCTQKESILLWCKLTTKHRCFSRKNFL